MMKKKKTAFLTTVFPMQKRFLIDFLDSLARQTSHNFDLIVVNDGYMGFKPIAKRFKRLKITEIKSTSTPAKNREVGINYCIKKGYQRIIFGDSDDWFDENRIKIVTRWLQRFDIVVNNMTLAENKQNILVTSYLLSRIRNHRVIQGRMMETSNIFGLSNTAIRTKKMKKITLPEDLIAVDWYFFTLLLRKYHKAVYLHESLTNYRQHADNTVGMGNNTEKKNLAHTIKVKLAHYGNLMHTDPLYEKLYKKYQELDQDIKSGMKIDRESIKRPLWWEEI